jgi:hypothetical protein
MVQSCSSADEFMQKLPSFDEDWAKQRSDAEAADEVSRCAQWYFLDSHATHPHICCILIMSLPFTSCLVPHYWFPSLNISKIHDYTHGEQAIFNLKVMRYVGVVDAVNKKGQVELQRYKKDHPFAQLSGSENIIAFTTSRYKEQPLMVRGPGAGAEVTAGGVFCDILQLASYLGAPS